MTEREAWLLEEEADGTLTLTAPNGEVLFTVSLGTLEMLGRMFLDEVQEVRESIDAGVPLYGR